MAVDKLVDSAVLNSNLTSVANAIRTKGGTSAQLAFPEGFVSAIGDIQTGGGITAPSNAVAFFPFEVTFTEQPASIKLDVSNILTLLTQNETYAWSVTFFRDDAVISTTYTYINQVFSVGGRISNNNAAVNLSYDLSTEAASLTSGTKLTATGIHTAGSLSSGKISVTFANTDTKDRTGKYKGVFAVIPPWTDAYTGTKVEECPNDFVTYTAVS